jgi:hypothetical protein
MTGFIHDKIKNPTRSLTALDKASATVTTVNQVLATTGAGLVVPATNTTVRSEIMGISNESITATQALTQVLAIEIFENDTFVVDSLNNSNAAHNYQRQILSDSLTVDNAGADDANGVVVQVEPFGPAADKKIIVRFV